MTLLKALLQALLARRQPSPAEPTRPFELLSIGAVATAEEARLSVDEVLPVVAPVRLSILTDSACDGEGHCMPWGAHMIVPDDVFASMLAMKVRWDESFDAIVVRLRRGFVYDSEHARQLAQYVHGLLRAGGLLVLGHQDGTRGAAPPATVEAWFAPWFAGAALAEGASWAGDRRPPRPVADVLRVPRPRSTTWDGGLNCTSRCFAALSRQHLAELRQLGRAKDRLRERYKAEPLDGHDLVLHFVLAMGRSLRSLEESVTVAATGCRVPLAPALELALALTFESMARACNRLEKLRFRLWTAHSPVGGRISGSGEHVGMALNFLSTAIRDALRPVTELQELVAEAASGMEGGVSSVRSESNSWLKWLPKGDGGEMGLTEIVYRRVFDAQQLDHGLLPLLLGEVFSRGDAVADFGASLGEYATFFNRTGSVTALAFDGTEGIAEVTKGVVLEVNLAQAFELWRAFDWVLCLEVLEHIPQEFERTALENLRRHARKGAIISWGNEWSTYTDAGHVNGQREEYVLEALRAVGFERDEAMTARLRKASRLWWVAETVAAYRVGGA